MFIGTVFASYDCRIPNIYVRSPCKLQYPTLACVHVMCHLQVSLTLIIAQFSKNDPEILAFWLIWFLLPLCRTKYQCFFLFITAWSHWNHKESVLLLNCSHCQRRASKFWPMLGAYGYWAKRVLYCATIAVTRDVGLAVLSKRQPI